jgi:hypothetical protein
MSTTFGGFWSSPNALIAQVNNSIALTHTPMATHRFVTLKSFSGSVFKKFENFQFIPTQ